MKTIAEPVQPPCISDTHSRMAVPFVEFQGVRIHTPSIECFLDHVIQAMLERQRALVVYVNAHALNLAHDQPWLKDFFNQSDLAYCDGFGVKWAARFLGVHIPYRYTPPDFFEELCARCARHDLSIYLLGAKPGVAQRVANQLRQQFSTLRIVGTQHGYFEPSLGSVENAAVIAHINSCRPDLLVVCLGMPRQERWLAENFAQLQVCVALSAGALCDYIAGNKRRPPRWMTNHGLEWLGRLLLEPRRLWRRYLIGNTLFIWRVLRERLAGHRA